MLLSVCACTSRVNALRVEQASVRSVAAISVSTSATLSARLVPGPTPVTAANRSASSSAGEGAVSTSVLNGRSKDAPANSQLHTQTPGGLGSAMKNRLPPEYESPDGPWKMPQAPVEERTIANCVPAGICTGLEKRIELKAPPPERLLPGTTCEAKTVPLGIPPATLSIRTSKSERGSQLTGTCTSASFPETPAVIVCASTWSEAPPTASPPMARLTIGCS